MNVPFSKIIKWKNKMKHHFYRLMLKDVNPEKGELGNILDSIGQSLSTNPERASSWARLVTVVNECWRRICSCLCWRARSTSEVRMPAIDSYGKVLYPIVKPDGGSIGKGSRNWYLDESGDGEPIKLDRFWLPFEYSWSWTNFGQKYIRGICLIGNTTTPSTHQIGPNDWLRIQTSKKVPPSYPESKNIPYWRISLNSQYRIETVLSTCWYAKLSINSIHILPPPKDSRQQWTSSI